ncbi:MAG TPA: NAD kinase [Burkholderiales bacterium]|nr:NAD kinase [Burkholderiales bacterium]
MADGYKICFNARMNNSFKIVALIGKYKSPEIVGHLLRLARFLEGRGVTVLVDRLTSAHLKKNNYPVLTLEEIGKQADLAIVLGGDGTMLNIARTFAPYDVALVGVNQGRLGFLTDISVDTMLETIGAILDGKYVTEERMLLSAEIMSNSKSVLKVLTFNDVVVSKGAKGSLIEFDVHIDGQFVYNLRSDGLIVATPTGSTAYALSSGGPIVHPSLNLIALVPVCPHTLSNRPIVVGGNSIVEILMHDSGDARAHFDSHSHFDLRDGDRIILSRSNDTIRLLHPVGHDYYSMLREKLHWSKIS